MHGDKKKWKKKKPAAPLMKMRLNICGLLRESDLGATATHAHTLTHYTHILRRKKKMKKIGLVVHGALMRRKFMLCLLDRDTFTKKKKLKNKRISKQSAGNVTALARQTQSTGCTK